LIESCGAVPLKDDRILTTKLHIPKLRKHMVSRTRLSERLSEGLHRKVTLISAPAGFGKTTLISEWLATCKREIAWFSMDEEDNDLTRFFTYLIFALQSISESIGSRLLPFIHSSQPLPAETIMTYVVDEISTLSKPCILVLDDLHVIQVETVYNAIHFLLDYMPPNVHLVISTRETAALRLSSLRVRDQITELNAMDLRFTVSETEGFMNRTMGLTLDSEAIHMLEARTEGWVAGLQLAALSMQGSTDQHAFIQSFNGRNHLVLDYVLEEVLKKYPEPVQNFLLRTAVLDRMCGSLCDALSDQEAEGDYASGQDVLEYLEQANLFIIPLDNYRCWYRYHHLFSDLLRYRLQRNSIHHVQVLHIRASEWYEAEGSLLEAFHHATEAGDIDRAARLLEGDGMPLHLRGAMAPVQHWLESLDRSVLDDRPALWVTYASALTVSGHPIDDVEEKLRMAETAIQQKEPSKDTSDLAGNISAIRAMLAIPQNDAEAIERYSKSALEQLRPDNLPIRTSATWTLGFAYQLQCEYALASQAYSEAIASGRATGNLLITIGATICLGQVQEAELQLHLAAESYKQAMQLAGGSPLPATCEAYFGMARLLHQWDRLAEAEEHGHQAVRLALQLTTIDTPAACYVLLARIKLSQGDGDGAAAQLDQAEQFLRSRHPQHQMQELTEVQGELLLRRGEIAAADKLTEKQEYNLALLRSRVLWAQGETAEALKLLESLLRNVNRQRQKYEWLKLAVVQAPLLYAHSEKESSLHMLGEALELAESSGIVRLFADEGEPLRQLLVEVHARGWMPDFTSQLLAAFQAQQDVSIPSTAYLLEPLTEREQQVLQLIAQGLSNDEIGKQLHLALDTVKGYNRRIYGKLDVRRRTEAVARARELGLIQ